MSSPVSHDLEPQAVISGEIAAIQPERRRARRSPASTAPTGSPPSIGTDVTQRMVTQMCFPGDPIFALHPICQSTSSFAVAAQVLETPRGSDVTRTLVGLGAPAGGTSQAA